MLNPLADASPGGVTGRTKPSWLYNSGLDNESMCSLIIGRQGVTRPTASLSLILIFKVTLTQTHAKFG